MERLSLSKRGNKGQEEQLDGFGNLLEGFWSVGKLGFSDETLPLNPLIFILPERRIKSRWFNIDRRVAVLECFFKCLGQNFASEVECAGKYPDVEEVFHPAVQDAELNYSLELLGDSAFHGIALQFRCWELKKRRICDLDRAGNDYIPESDIYLHGNSRIAEATLDTGRARTPLYSASSEILTAVTVSAL